MHSHGRQSGQNIDRVQRRDRKKQSRLEGPTGEVAGNCLLDRYLVGRIKTQMQLILIDVSDVQMVWLSQKRLITLLTSQQTFLIPMLGLGMSIKNVGSYGVKVVINKKWSLPDSHIKNGGRSPGNGTPKSSILIGFSIINHPFWGTPILGNHPYTPGREYIDGATAQPPSSVVFLFSGP